MREKYNIGIEVTMEVISGKWKPVILCFIGSGINRNGELLRAIPEISQKVLTEQLKQLVTDGILTKIVYPGLPLRVEYAFTDYGESLKDVLLTLCKWGEGHAEKLTNEHPESPVKIGDTEDF